MSRNTNTLLRNMHRGPQHDMLPLADWKADSIAENVERKYLSAFPEMKEKYLFCLCDSANGIANM